MIIDLSQLPEPEVIENLDFETIYQELLGDFREAMAGEWTAEVESDPVLKLLQLAAYRELLLRARIWHTPAVPISTRSVPASMCSVC